MRTGLAWSTANLQMVENLFLRRAVVPRPTLPGLILYLSSAAAQSGYSLAARGRCRKIANDRHVAARVQQPAS